MMNSFLKMILAIAAFCFFAGFIYFSFVPEGRTKWNNYWHKMQKVDDATLYRTRKSVEDNCRAMQASYEADKITYEQYKDSENSEERSWGQQAKMRANRTAANYNKYILENNYVWKDNIPDDIRYQLKYLDF